MSTKSELDALAGMPGGRRIVGDPAPERIFPDLALPLDHPRRQAEETAAQKDRIAGAIVRARGLGAAYVTAHPLDVDSLRRLHRAVAAWTVARRSPAEPGRTLAECRVVFALRDEIDVALGLGP